MSRRLVAVLLGSVVLVVGAVVVIGRLDRDRAAAQVGDPAPPLDAPSLVAGERVRTPAGGYLVNFWGSWCEPCKRELPRLAAAHAAGTPIVGVAVRSSNRLARELLAETGATWPSATDPEAAIAARWGVASGFPVTVAVDRTGTIRKKHFGELSEDDIATLAALIR